MENVKNINLMYGVGGLALGVVLCSLFSFSGHDGRYDGKYQKHTSETNMMHEMPDGTMMSDEEMSMDTMMKSMMMALEGKTGDAFDKAFLSEMIVHHEGAVVMAKAVLTSSKRPELIKLANGIISAQTKEIDMMRGWQNTWFK